MTEEHQVEGGKQQDTEPDAVKKSGGIFRRLLLSLLIAGILIGGAVFLAIQTLDERFNRPQEFSGQVFRIEKGDTPRSFARQLQQAGISDAAFGFDLLARYRGLAGKLHTGHYRFPDGRSLVEVLDSITSGKDRLSYTFTFVQGSTFKQLRESLAAAKSVVQTLDGHSDAEVLALFDSGQEYTHPEGLFFPETYAYDPGASDRDILQRAYDMMQETLDELWPKRDPGIEIGTAYEALTLASIIEKETALASERKQISGVFMNRLKKGMKLQTDPTVIYGLGDQYDGNITRTHLKTDTPYNTYTRTGLPTTPIRMPGRDAI